MAFSALLQHSANCEAGTFQHWTNSFSSVCLRNTWRIKTNTKLANHLLLNQNQITYNSRKHAFYKFARVRQKQKELGVKLLHVPNHIYTFKCTLAYFSIEHRLIENYNDWRISPQLRRNSSISIASNRWELELKNSSNFQNINLANLENWKKKLNSERLLFHFGNSSDT